MNLNHDPDAHLLEQIDKRLNTQQPTGNSAIDELAATVPVPREAFQQALEARLLAKLEIPTEGKTIMTAKSVYIPIRSAQRGWIPLTLLAAMLVIVIAVGIILIGSRPSASEVSLAQQSTTATTTPIIVTAFPTSQPVAVNLPVDRTAIEVPLALLADDSLTPKVGESVEILALLPFSGSPSSIANVPATALPDGTRLVEKFVVFDAAVLAQGEAEQTVVVSVPSDEGRLLAWLVEQGITLRLQAPRNSGIQNLGNRRVIDIPIENLTAVENIQVGDAVNIYSTCAFVAVLGVIRTLDCDQALEEKQADGVVIFGELAVADQPQVNNKSIAVAVMPDVYVHIAELTAASMHFKLVKAPDTHSVVPSFTPTPMLIPSDKVAISLPVSSLNLPEGENFPVGGAVDVIATYKMADVSEAPSEFQQVMTPESGEISEMTQRMVKAAPVVGVSESPVQTIILAVSPQEAVILEWVLAAQLSIILRHSPPDAAASASPYTLQLALNSLSQWATDDIQVGDSVDLVMGFVLGNTDTVTLDYQRYGTHTWGDSLSDGSISAQIYAPENGQAGGGAAFMLRVLHGAVITAVQVSTDPVSGRMSNMKVMLEVPAGTRSALVEAINGYVEAGIPYLLVTP